jgi:hypothetical protein
VVAVDSRDKTRAVLSVGKDDWPLPVPIVKKAGKWYFDSKQGRDEILYRRIGANELDALQVCRGFVEAQHEYASDIYDGSGINHTRDHRTPEATVCIEGEWQPRSYQRSSCSRHQEGYSSGNTSGYRLLLRPRGKVRQLAWQPTACRLRAMIGASLLAFSCHYHVTCEGFWSADGVVYEGLGLPP